MNSAIEEIREVDIQARFAGCTLLMLAGLLISLILGAAILWASSSTLVAPDVSNSLMLVFPCLVLAGFVVAIVLSIMVGPLMWPASYKWIQNRPTLYAMLPGAVAGWFTGPIWVYIIFELSGRMAEVFLVSLVILLPFACLVAPIAGALGGWLTAKIVSRFKGRVSAFYLAGFIGGGLAAGLMFTAITLSLFLLLLRVE